MSRFRLPLLFVLLVGICLASVSTGVEARPDVFDVTESELTARRDGPLSGTDLDKTAKKRLKAVTKALDVLAADPAELQERVKALQKIDARLRKPFKDEFGPEPGVNDLGRLLADDADILLQLVAQQRDDLAARVPAAKVKVAQVDKQVAAADKALAKAAAATTIKKRVKALFAALAKLKKGEKLLTKLLDSGSGGDGFSVTIIRDGVSAGWTASSVSAEYAPGSGDLQIFATGPRSAGDTIEYTIFFNITGVDEDDTYPVGDGDGQFQIVDTTLPIIQRLTHRFVANGTGSVTVTKLDTGKPRIEGTFSFETVLESDAGVSADLEAGSFATGDVDLR